MDREDPDPEGVVVAEAAVAEGVTTTGATIVRPIHLPEETPVPHLGWAAALLPPHRPGAPGALEARAPGVAPVEAEARPPTASNPRTVPPELWLVPTAGRLCTDRRGALLVRGLDTLQAGLLSVVATLGLEPADSQESPA